MSRAGRIAAAEHAESLHSFDGMAEAKTALYAFRDDRLALLSRLALASGEFEPDYQPESLKGLEWWYFDLAASQGFARLGVAVEIFEECVAMYFFEVAVRNTEVEWTVQEYAFGPGLYQIGVRRVRFMMFGSRRRPRRIDQQNKRKQSMWREYQRYFGQGSVG